MTKDSPHNKRFAPMIKNICLRCGREFESIKPSKGCSNACRNKLWLDNNPDKRARARAYSLKYGQAKKQSAKSEK